MQDLQTESLWSQVTGECIWGPMEGTKLKLFPSIHTTFAEFKKLYPTGLLLKKPTKGEAGSPYDNYYADRDKLGVFGRVNNFEKLNGKDKIFGLNLGNNQIAVSEEYLTKNGYALLPEDKPSILLTYNKTGKTASAFSLDKFNTNDLKDLIIEEERITLRKGANVWHYSTGKIIEGDMNDLEVLPVISSYWFAWISFFPETVLIK